MEYHRVVPDVIDFAPPQDLQVEYEGGIRLEQGKPLTPTQVKNVPRVNWPADSGSLYTLMMVDPDAPSRQKPELGEVLHWLVADIPGNAIERGKVCWAYIGSGAPKNTGLHRYVVLVFKQTNGPLQGLNGPVVSARSLEGRFSFKTRIFMKDHGLQLVAGNFFQAEWDDYVPILTAQFEKK